MLRLAGREADGAIINWLAADDVRRVIPYVHEAGPDKEIVARIFVAPTSDPAAARAVGRAAIAGYLDRACLPGVSRMARPRGRPRSDVERLGGR